MKCVKALLLSTALLSLTACSTLVSGTQQSVFVDTPQMTGAECKLTDSKNGAWYLQNTPGSVTVGKGNGPMNIVCTKEGYTTATVASEEEFAGATLGNVILGGGIGILVDAASGAAQKYPDKVVVWMKPTHFDTAAARQSWETEKAAYEKKLTEEAEKNKKTETSNNRSHS